MITKWRMCWVVGVCTAMIPAWQLHAAEIPVEPDDGIGEYSDTMTIEERKAFLLKLYHLNTQNPKTWSDVMANDQIRGQNYGRRIDEGDAYEGNKPFYHSIPRPSAEDEVLAGDLRERLEEARQGNYQALLEMLRKVSYTRFSSRDERLGQMLMDFLSSGQYDYSFDRQMCMLNALRMLGTIHTETTIAFMRSARKGEFWLTLPSLQGLDEQEGGIHAKRLAHWTVDGIERLPLDMAIELLEEMYAWLTPDHSSYRRVLKSLDRLWQQKKREYHRRWRSTWYGGMGRATERYPEWLFGPGGKKIHKPFGDDPEIADRRKRIEELIRQGVQISPDLAEKLIRDDWGSDPTEDTPTPQTKEQSTQ